MKADRIAINGTVVYDKKEELTKKLDLATAIVSTAKRKYEDAKSTQAEFKEENQDLLDEYSDKRKAFNNAKNDFADALLEYYELNNAKKELEQKEDK